jgi:hypothetical protein
MDNTSKQKSCGGINFHCSILIKVEKLTTHEDFTFFPSEGELAY